MTDSTTSPARSEEARSGSPLIIGIGASAGGLEALQQFFQHMPGNSGACFVVVQHLSPDYKSLMADILGKHTQMRVIQAENDMPVRASTVFLIPPKNNMTIKDGKLHLTEFVPGMLNHPIDVFFNSLAEEKKERAIVVVMSGTGSDGTSGIKVVKEHGGLVIVQDPETAKFDGMPRSVINTGLADFVLSPDEIVDEILNFSNYPTLIKAHGRETMLTDEETFVQIYAILKKISDPPFGKLDLISCRNVMIYFQPVLQKSLFAIFHTALKNNGYLFLGKSETAGEYSNVFKAVCSAEKIYIHKGEGKVDEFSPPSFNIPNIRAISPRAAGTVDREQGDSTMETAYIHFLESFLPASVVLNEANNVIHCFGNYTDYMAIAPGKATFNFFSMVNKDLSLVASTALNRCRSEHIAVTYTGIQVDCPSGQRTVNLTVSPVPGRSKEDTGLIAVLFMENMDPAPDGVTEKYDVDTTAARRIADLEQELHESQNDLKSTIGELETVNEELQAANEELLTANEELQSSNEELQSVNEELYTVNTEYQQKLDELTMLTNDLSNFLSSTMIGILFVDSNLNIRKFTEYVGREFQLMEHDVGRSFQIFAHSFPDEDIIQDAKEVLKSLVPIDREVTAMNGRYYTLRIAPYRTTENNIRGLVITIIDSLGADNKS